MNSDLFLVIDFGTQSVRAIIFNVQGDLVAMEKVAIIPYYQQQAGWAEQNADYFWQQLCLATQGLMRKNTFNKNAIKALSLTTQRATVINVDKDGRPLRDAISWVDKRSTRNFQPLKGLLGAAIRLSGYGEFIRHVQSHAQINWLRAHQPEIWQKTHKFLYLSGFITHRLIGDFRDSIGCQVGYMPFDYKKMTWSVSGSLNQKLMPLETEKCVTLIEPGRILGTITKQASLETGIPQGLALIASAGDKACEVLGVGALRKGIGAICLGTTATINVMEEKYIEPFLNCPAYPAAIPGHYNLEVQFRSGFWLISWFIKEFGHIETQDALARGTCPEELLDELLKATPPGAEGLFVQPYWTSNPIFPGIEAKGVIAGFAENHNRAHVYRALIEGLAFGLRGGTEHLEKRSKHPIRDIRVAGGGAHSPYVLQILADVFGTEIKKSQVLEASGLGAAINAAVGVGAYSNYFEATAQMVKPGIPIAPNMQNHELYQQIYHKIYAKTYRRLKPLYREIDRIFHTNL